MAQSIVIHGLVSKRAELSGEISEAEKRLERLRADLDSLDATIRLSDPTVAPKTIKPRVKRTGRSRSRSGELTRTTLSICGRPIDPFLFTRSQAGCRRVPTWT
jgi:hypothetical protein